MHPQRLCGELIMIIAPYRGQIKPPLLREVIDFEYRTAEYFNPDFSWITSFVALKYIFNQIVQGFLQFGIIGQGETYGGSAGIMNGDASSDHLGGINQ